MLMLLLLIMIMLTVVNRVADVVEYTVVHTDDITDVAHVSHFVVHQSTSRLALPFPPCTAASCHRLRGSASNVNGDGSSQWEMANFDPHRIETHEPTATNTAQLITSARGPPKPNLVQIHQVGASG